MFILHPLKNPREETKIQDVLKRLLYFILFFLAAMISSQLKAQDKSRLIQVNGFITDNEKNPVPRATIVSHRIRKGTVSESTGIYSLISVTGDTVSVSALGYKKVIFSVPSNIEGKLYEKDITLVSDTISIEGVTVFPWKSYGEFKKDFLAHQVMVSPQIKNMYDNLASIQATLEATPSYSSTPEAGFRMAMQQVANANYTRGQSPMNNLINPFAWAKFFKGVKNGLLRNEKSAEKVKKAKVKAAKSKSKEETTQKS